MGSHSVTCHPKEVRIPHLPPAEAVTRFSDPGGMQGWVDLCYVKADRTGIEPATCKSQVPTPYRWANTPVCVDVCVRHRRMYGWWCAVVSLTGPMYQHGRRLSVHVSTRLHGRRRPRLYWYNDCYRLMNSALDITLLSVMICCNINRYTHCSHCEVHHLQGGPVKSQSWNTGCSCMGDFCWLRSVLIGWQEKVRPL